MFSTPATWIIPQNTSDQQRLLFFVLRIMEPQASLAGVISSYHQVRRWADLIISVSPNEYHSIVPTLSFINFNAQEILINLEGLQVSENDEALFAKLADATFQMIGSLSHRRVELCEDEDGDVLCLRYLGSALWRRRFLGAQLIFRSRPLVDTNDSLSPSAFKPDIECGICLEGYTPEDPGIELPCHPKHQMYMDCLRVSRKVPFPNWSTFIDPIAFFMSFFPIEPLYWCWVLLWNHGVAGILWCVEQAYALSDVP